MQPACRRHVRPGHNQPPPSGTEIAMTEGLYWGLPVILYLFLAGTGAGTVAVSASMFLRGGGNGRGVHADIARYGALLGPLPIMIGCGLLVLDLASFQAGHWFRFIN